MKYEKYTVRSGDTLSKIAGRVGTTSSKLWRFDGGTGTPNSSRLRSGNRNRIYTGEVILVPSKRIHSKTGRKIVLVSRIETREIFLAQGTDRHEEDLHYWKTEKNYGYGRTLDYLKSEIGGDFKIKSKEHAEYLNKAQHVKFILRIGYGKDDFKKALETPGVHVVYNGHSRYGRGACFDIYEKKSSQAGNQWGSGNDNKDGIFRLGYPALAIPLSDIKHHSYQFSPYPEGRTLPPIAHRHPEARGRISLITLDDETLQALVKLSDRSPNNKYYGFAKRGEKKLLLSAGWDGTPNSPFDLGATTLNCKVFCHFGCSSRLHFWKIVRTSSFKNWNKPRPPTDRFAYFTTDVSNEKDSLYWLLYLMKYPNKNNFDSWYDSLEWAKRRTNARLRRERERFRLY